jgi:hypothetical protein
MTTHEKTIKWKASKRKKTGENRLEIKECRKQELVSDMMFRICIKWKRCQEKEEAEKDLTYRNMLKPKRIVYFDLGNCILPFLTKLVTCKGQ